MRLQRRESFALKITKPLKIPAELGVQKTPIKKPPVADATGDYI